MLEGGIPVELRDSVGHDRSTSTAACGRSPRSSPVRGRGAVRRSTWRSMGSRATGKPRPIGLRRTSGP